MHCASATLVWDRYVRHLFVADACVRVISLGAGLGLWTLAMRGALGQRFRYAAFAEAHPVVSRVHLALWAELGFHPAPLGWAHTAATAACVPRADLALISLACAPFSAANRCATPEAWRQACCELHGALNAAVASGAQVVMVEQTASILRGDMTDALRMYVSVLAASPELVWSYCVVCPFLHAAVPIRRLRVFFVGERR